MANLLLKLCSCLPVVPEVKHPSTLVIPKHTPIDHTMVLGHPVYTPIDDDEFNDGRGEKVNMFHSTHSVNVFGGIAPSESIQQWEGVTATTRTRGSTPTRDGFSHIHRHKVWFALDGVAIYIGDHGVNPSRQEAIDLWVPYVTGCLSIAAICCSTLTSPLE